MELEISLSLLQVLATCPCPSHVYFYFIYLPVFYMSVSSATQHSFLYGLSFSNYVRNLNRILKDIAFNRYRVLAQSNHLP
jgi:hypothetical protein